MLTINRGDNWTQRFLILDDGAPMDLSVVTLARFTIKNKPDDPDSAALIRLSTGVGGVLILPQDVSPEADPPGTLGCIDVSLTHADTKSLVTADYRCMCDLQLTLNDGSVVTPIIDEVFIAGDVTHNSGDVGTD